MNKFIGHLSTINKHRHMVTKMCFKCGMYKQGLLHDLSKYSLVEFIPSVKYYQGNKSPITYEKQIKGYSICWLHHKGRNKHHWDYWVDISKGQYVNYDMPFNYVLECVIDKIAASKVYKKQDYTDNYPYEFFTNSIEINVMNSENARKIQTLLDYLRNNGLDKTLEYIKTLYSKWKKDNNFTI